MRDLCTHVIHAFMWVTMVLMVWMLYGVLSQPMVFADEKREMLRPGYMPQATERPQIDSKRFSRSEAYLYDPMTGKTTHVELRSYTQGSRTYYTGKVGRANITVEPEVRRQLREE